MLIVFLCFITGPFVFAADDSVKKLTFDGMVDTYYAYDFNRPDQGKRLYTTQPAKHDDPRVNLAYLAAGYKTESLRARLALQAGDSVTQNTLQEPALGNSGHELSAKVIQEAYLGAKLGENTWLDAGVYLGHIGAESWLSKENWTYTRALNLDYVPYYSAGLRLSHKLNEKESLQVHLMNGWQNMGENNQAKALGVQYHRLMTKDLSFLYNNFFGDEEVVPDQNLKFRPRFRGYHNFILKWIASEKWQYLAALDFGHQAQQNNSGIDGLWAATLTVRRVLNDRQSVALRLENYQDPHEINVATQAQRGFEVGGASLNFDQKIADNALWRTEIRNFQSRHAIYPARSRLKNHDTFVVSSLSFWF